MIFFSNEIEISKSKISETDIDQTISFIFLSINFFFGYVTFDFDQNFRDNHFLNFGSACSAIFFSTHINPLDWFIALRTNLNMLMMILFLAIFWPSKEKESDVNQNGNKATARLESC